MFRSYVLTALKVISKHPLYSLVKILGLALGLAAFFLIAAFVRFELSFDRFHADADRIVRIVKEDQGNYYLGSNRFAVTPAPLARAMMADLPAVEVATQFNTPEVFLSAGDNSFLEKGLGATSTFFQVFSFELIRGDVSSPFSGPESILLTPALAERLFGDTDPVGQTVEYRYYETRYSLTVAGLVAEPPANAHFSFSFITPLSLDQQYERGLMEDQWGNNSWYTYAKLRPGADMETFGSQLAALGESYLTQLEWYRENGRKTTFYPQALPDIHLRSHINFEIGANGDIRAVMLFGLIALAILFTASVNYMNLATARATTRAKEIGIRKASGAGRSQLMAQFLGESVAISLFALLLAMVLVSAAQPLFRDLVGRHIGAEFIADQWALGLAFLVAIAVGILSGFYPAIVMSGFRPVDILKGASPSRKGRGVVRSSLVVAQFAVGVMLIFSTIVVGQQIRYVGNAETGIGRDQVVAIRVRDRGLATRWEALADELRSTPGVLMVSASGSLPTAVDNQNGVQDWTGRTEGQTMAIYRNDVRFGYESLLGLEIVEGRALSPEFGQNGLVINERARRQLGWDRAVGKTITLGSTPEEVVGVVKDFHFQSFRQEIAPLALRLQDDWIGRVLVKVAPNEIPKTMAGIGAVMAGFAPEFPFEYQFLDDAYNQMYAADRKMASLFAAFTVVALLIACLGLFGMAAFMAQIRRKEIGVRKVLGAGVGSIVGLMAIDLGRFVIFAVLLGGPVAYFGMQRWLDGFAYRVDPGWSTFAWTALSALLITFLTVAWQSVHAALGDPVRSLRHE